MTDAERAVIHAAADEEARRPVPANLGPTGCVLFLASLGLFALVPRLLVAPSARVLAFVLVAVGIFSGLALFFFFGAARAERRVRERAGAALELLATRFATLSPAERLQAATRLVMNGTHARGARVRQTIEPASARAALGDALELVRAVESVLVQDAQVPPVFTLT